MKGLLMYLITPFEVLGWTHALYWGFMLGMVIGMLLYLLIETLFSV